MHRTLNCEHRKRHLKRMLYKSVFIHGNLRMKNGELRELFWIDGNSHWLTASMNGDHVTNSSNRNTNYAKFCKSRSSGILM
jgi:hypothetical protein